MDEIVLTNEDMSLLVLAVSEQDDIKYRELLDKLLDIVELTLDEYD